MSQDVPSPEETEREAHLDRVECDVDERQEIT